MKKIFEVGDKAQLASGGPEMTIIQIEDGLCRCVFWVEYADGNGHFAEHTLPKPALREVEDA